MNARLATCKDCAQLMMPLWTCKVCGCLMLLKTAAPRAKCPLGKW